MKKRRAAILFFAGTAFVGLVSGAFLSKFIYDQYDSPLKAISESTENTFKVTGEVIKPGIKSAVIKVELNSKKTFVRIYIPSLSDKEKKIILSEKDNISFNCRS